MSDATIDQRLADSTPLLILLEVTVSTPISCRVANAKLRSIDENCVKHVTSTELVRTM